ncbi:MAG TPA: hypothetical protein PLC18_13640 [Sediminibacterium sp.]|jgi:hypothetical protein|uniref:hypothetical protein n=1 Tax=Sediminibacterium sp. TaxID=1917865 RepID=UPI0026B8F0D5|nr:hypothetical protein [Sediminibacterium sp.]HQS23200.1 hypothetical protein [Sediminibacterium sp.]HQS36453.1 hypothetical protein [Sediminibacterium sp.]
MGHIKEPKGVDFVIASDPLTEKARKEISEFIRNYTTDVQKKKNKSTTTSKRPKLAHT